MTAPGTRSREPLPRKPAGVVATAVTATVVATLPPCLLGALGLVIRTDLSFDAAQLGIAAGAFYAASAIAALFSGRYALAEALGVRRSIFTGVAIVTLVMLYIAFLAGDWIQIAIANVVAGLANGLTQPAANLALALRVPDRRMGLAFGIKQAAVPTATLLAGLAVGLLAVLGDWRTAFWLGGAASLAFVLLAVLLGRPVRASASSRPARTRLRTYRISPALWRATIAAGLASVGANAMRVFFIEAAVDRGEDLAVAGFVLAAASIVAIGTRLYGGWRSDAVPRNPYVSAAALILAGSAGYLLMAFAEGTAFLVLAAILGISAGWGWSGLVQLGTVRAHADAPGAASAFIHFGSLFGSLIGPVLFGLLLAFGFPLAWITSAVIAALGGVLLLIGSRAQTAGTSTRTPSAADR